MNRLHSDRLKSVFWLIVVGSWVSGFIVFRWIGSSEILISLSKVVRVPNPIEIDIWWQIIAYFTLSTVSVFALSHILFGIGSTIFLFARGMYDSLLFNYVEKTVSQWNITNVSTSELSSVLIVIIIFGVNLPLALWAGQLGIQRSVYTLNRLRGEPMNPEFGSEPISKLLMVIVLSLITGLIMAVVFSYL